MRTTRLLRRCAPYVLLASTGCPAAGDGSSGDTTHAGTTSVPETTGSTGSTGELPTSSSDTTHDEPPTGGATGSGSTDTAPTTGDTTEMTTGVTACPPGLVEACYDGPADTERVGACHAGTRACLPDGSGFGPCEDQVVPGDEDCEHAGDEDCDGLVDEAEDCDCEPGAVEECYDGPPRTANVGACVEGTRVCAGDGRSFGPCVGAVVPKPEQCGTFVDDDCDGQVNEADAGCVCPPLSMQGCYTGTPDTDGIGTCKAGNQLCNEAGTAYGPCLGEVVDQREQCGTGEDEDCDDLVDEDCNGAPWRPAPLSELLGP